MTLSISGRPIAGRLAPVAVMLLVLAAPVIVAADQADPAGDELILLDGFWASDHPESEVGTVYLPILIKMQ